MKTFRLFSMAALALMMGACSEEVNETVEPQPAPAPGVIEFSGTVTTKDGGVTRTTMTEQSDGSLNVTWKVDDVIYFFQGGAAVGNASVQTINEDGLATIIGKLEDGDPDKEFDLMYYGGWNAETYLNEALLYQYGTLDGLGTYDYRVGTAKIIEDPENAGQYILDGAVTMKSQMAIWKLTLKDGGGNALNVTTKKSLTIKSDDVDIAVTGGSDYFLGGSTNVVYLAMYPVDNKTITVTYNDGTNDYTFSKAGISLAAGTYYQSEVTLTKVIDLSKLASHYTSLSVTSDVILTGAPTTDNIFQIRYDVNNCEVTLDNVNTTAGKYISIDGKGFDGKDKNVNVKLKGTSRLQFIVTSKNVTIGEAAAGGTLILNSPNTYAIYSSETVTINGGTVKAKTTNDNFATVSADNLVINGGNVYLAGGAVKGAVDVTGDVSDSLYGWNGSSWGYWDAGASQQYASTDNSANPSTWTW